MRVKALRSINEYYALRAGELYDVQGIIYFATPFFSNTAPTEIDNSELRGFINPVYSYGVIRNELVYLIETITLSGRKTLARFNAANFEVVDSLIPNSWSTSAIDLYREVFKVKTVFDKQSTDSSMFDKPLEALKSYGAVAVITGESKLHTFEYLYTICDDDSDTE